jgi:hypothetical protein
MMVTRTAAPGVDMLTSELSIPGLGTVPVNAFVLHGDEPMLVDTGAPIASDEFLAALRTVIEPADSHLHRLGAKTTSPVRGRSDPNVERPRSRRHPDSGIPPHGRRSIAGSRSVARPRR